MFDDSGNVKDNYQKNASKLDANSGISSVNTNTVDNLGKKVEEDKKKNQKDVQKKIDKMNGKDQYGYDVISQISPPPGYT